MDEGDDDEDGADDEALSDWNIRMDPNVCSYESLM